MIHPAAFASDATGLVITVTFTPAGGDFASGPVSVAITASAGSKIRWQIDAGAKTTVDGLSATVSVPISNLGHTLTAEVLDSAGNVLVTHAEDYFKTGHGGGGGQ